MSKIIASKSRLKCSEGTSYCVISENNSVYIEGRPVIKITNKNISDFGMCNSPTNPQVMQAKVAPQPCIPFIVSNWINNTRSYAVESSDIVMEGARINCVYGGSITISNSYAKTVIKEDIGPVNKPNSAYKKSEKINSIYHDIDKADSSKELQSLGKKVDSCSVNKEKDSVEDSFNICPLCGNRMDSNHNNLYYDDDTPKRVKSIPDLLKCEKIKGERIGKFKTANHHIIPVNEVYNKFEDLVVLSLKCGFDINDPRNGIPLPTPAGANPYEIINSFGETFTMNFGKLEKDKKRNIAYKHMRELGKQWHSGHHSYNLENETYYAHMNYSKEVIKVLTRFEKDLLSANLCFDTDKRDAIQEKFYKICTKIRKRLDAFQEDPKKSKPFYVSKYAADFAEEMI